MKRVAALWLPNWSIDRIMRAEPKLAPPPERAVAAPNLRALRAAAREEQVLQCDAPKNTGWRPGARWARSGMAEPKGQSRQDVEMQIAALPHHQRPPMRMLGRSSVAAEHPFRAMPPDEARSSIREIGPRAETGQHPLRPDAMPSACHSDEEPRPDRHRLRGSNNPNSAPPCEGLFRDARPTMAGSGVVLVTTHKVGSRTEIAAASPAAKVLGIEPGMPLTQVRASVPNVIVRHANPQADAADLHRLAVLIARRWTPLVALSDADTLFLDLTGVAHLYGGEARMAAKLLRLLARFGFSARIAVANTAGAAWALARFAADPVQICSPDTSTEALAPLPAAGLRLENTTLALLQRLGIDTIGDVIALPRAPFARRFGAHAARCVDQALGDAAEPLRSVLPPKTIHVVQRFDEPIGSAEVINHWLGKLVPRLTEALTQAGQGVRTLVFLADRIDGQPQSIRIGFARPNRDPVHILRMIARRIEEVDPGFGIDALHLHVRRAEPLGAQPFHHTLESSTLDLGGLVDLLSNRNVPTWRNLPHESDVPERSVTQCRALDTPSVHRARSQRDNVRQLDVRRVDHPWQSRWPRPACLLRRPERLEHVLAELPDQPPRRFTWRGEQHNVVRADGPERITGEWWKRAAERDAVRDYFVVEDDAGQRFWLFRRGDGEREATGDLTWYLHGRFG